MRVLSLLFLLIAATLAWNPSAMAESFNNPLVDAADLGQKDKVSQLLKSGYKPDSKGDFGVTALMRAAFRGNLEIVHLLLENGAYVNASDIGGETALHLAARNGYPDVVKELLNSDAFIDIPDKENWTPLMRAVVGKQPEVANILIEKGADLTAVNERGESVLVHAAIIGKPEIMKMILGSNSFTKIPEEQRKTAMMQAEKKGNEEVGKMLSATTQYIKKQAEKKETTELASANNNTTTAKKSDNELSSTRYSSIKQDSAPEKEDADIPPVDWNSDKAKFKPLETTPKIKTAESSISKSTDKKPLAVKPTKPVADEAVAYTMQLGSFTNEDRALTVWNNLQSSNPDLLSQLDPDVLALPSAKGKDYYLRAGRYEWKDIAESSCSSLRTRNIDCLALPVSANQRSLMAKSESKPVEKAETEPKPAAPALPAPKPVDKNAPKNIIPGKEPEALAQNIPTAENELPWMNTPDYKPRQTWTLPEEALPPVTQQSLPPLEVPPQYQEYQSEPVAEQNSAPQQQFFNNMVDNQAAIAESRYNTQLPPKAATTPIKQPEVIKPTAQEATPVPAAKKEQNYNEFYKEIEQGDKRPVSEAVLVPDDLYFSDSVSDSGPATNWLKIGNFADREAANDYADRMFRYDENLSGLDITIAGNQPKLNLFVGPLSGSDANNLCATVRSGNMQCSAASDPSGKMKKSTNPISSAPVEKPIDAPRQLAPIPEKVANDYWINLGIFGDAPEAEYYWGFLLEDNQDILANLKYNMITPENKGEHGKDAIQLQVGPFNSDSRATQICNILKFRNVACLIVR